MKKKKKKNSRIHTGNKSLEIKSNPGIKLRAECQRIEQEEEHRQQQLIQSLVKLVRRHDRTGRSIVYRHIFLSLFLSLSLFFNIRLFLAFLPRETEGRRLASR